jgi:hypothetical protein
MLALSVAGTTDVFDAHGKRVGSLREKADGRVDVYDAESNRAGWGRRNRDGSIELFDTDGRRLGTVDRNGNVRTLDQRRDGARMPLRPGWSWDRERPVPQKGGRR